MGYFIYSEHGTFAPFAFWDWMSNPESIAKKTYGGDNPAGVKAMNVESTDSKYEVLSSDASLSSEVSFATMAESEKLFLPSSKLTKEKSIMMATLRRVASDSNTTRW